MPVTMSLQRPLPCESKTFTAMTLAEGATPATLMPLLVAAAAIPATCEPCPLSSLPASEPVTHEPLVQS